MKESLKLYKLCVIFSAVFLASCNGGEETSERAAGAGKSSKSIESNADVKSTRDVERIPDSILTDIPVLSLQEAEKKDMRFCKPTEDSKEYRKAAEAAMNRDDYESCETLMTRAIDLNPNVVEFYFYRGKARNSSFTQKTDGAIEDFEKAIEMGTKDPGVYESLAGIYDSRKQPDKAIEVLTMGISVCGDTKKLYRARATVYLGRGDKEKALSDYNKALEMTPSFTRGYIMRAQLYESLGRYEEALQDYENVSKFEHEETKADTKSVAKKLRAALLSKLDRHKEALEVLDKALLEQNNDDELLRLRGEQYMALKQYDKAIADLTRSIEVAPHYARMTYEARSKAYEAAGKPELAAKDRERAAQLKETPAEKPVY